MNPAPTMPETAPIVPGHVFWLMGLSGAGKSTLADALVDALRRRAVPVLVLDGDALRGGLCRGLGFSDADRLENLRRAAEAARLGADSGLCVAASFITPLETHRGMIREIVGPSRISIVFANAPLEVCRQRDVKGLYARADAGGVPLMTGLGSRFESPAQPDLALPTGSDPPPASAGKLVEFARTKLALMHFKSQK